MYRPDVRVQKLRSKLTFNLPVPFIRSNGANRSKIASQDHRQQPWNLHELARPNTQFALFEGPQTKMTIRAMAKTCLAIFGGFNIVFLLTSPLNRWIENLTPFMTSSSGSIDNNTVAGLFSYLQERNQENNSQYWDHTETEAFSNNNISIIVELSGELGNHLNHIAHGRILQIMLLRDYNIVTHLVLRRNSNDEKYRRTQRQLTKCFTKLRQLEFHQPQSSALTSQKTLDRIQATLLGKDLADALHLYGGTSINMTQQSIQVLASQVKKQHVFAMRNETMAAKGVSFPFLRTNAMINRDMMDKFYDELREFFDFDEEACCAMEDLPDPNVTVFVSHEIMK